MEANTGSFTRPDDLAIWGCAAPGCLEAAVAVRRNETSGEWGVCEKHLGYSPEVDPAVTEANRRRHRRANDYRVTPPPSSCPYCRAAMDPREPGRVFTCGFDGNGRTKACRDRERLIAEIRREAST
jgi:hypothetical protein